MPTTNETIWTTGILTMILAKGMIDSDGLQDRGAELSARGDDAVEDEGWHALETARSAQGAADKVPEHFAVEDAPVCAPYAICVCRSMLARYSVISGHKTGTHRRMQ